MPDIEDLNEHEEYLDRIDDLLKGSWKLRSEKTTQFLESIRSWIKDAGRITESMKERVCEIEKQMAEAKR